MKKTEQKLQTALATFIKLQYPDAIFTSESSGLRVPIGLAIAMKSQRCEGKLPDFHIFEPSMIGSKLYFGLFLELKASNASPFLKDGSLSKDKHVQEQARMLDRLKKRGYWAQFAVGIDQAMEVITKYLNGKKQLNPERTWD